MINQDDPSRHTRYPVARLSGDFHYRIEGDRARLGADVTILDPQSLGQQRCLLQLWACHSRFDGGTLQGIKVAECPIDIQDTTVSVAEQSTLALPPAGQEDYAIVLTLVAVDGSGAVQLHDYVNFDNRQAFTQPMLLGEVECELASAHVDLRVERILNPRAASNLSGSLTLELWALHEPYRGGAFSGTLLATTTQLGTLCGGFEWLQNRFNLDLMAVPAGDAYLVLMLREWSEAGRLTRDYRVLPRSVGETPIPADPVEEGPCELEAEPEQAPLAEAPIEAEPKSCEPVQLPPLESVPHLPACQAVEIPLAGAPVDAPHKAPAKEPVEASSAVSLVSINRASARELEKVKFLSARLARAIILERPFGSLDALIQVRGIGRVTLERIRPFLCI
ncbi:ComEA family DNA-binding protein [Marinobacterium rhizophilum]|uniref:ComEA family DNA-binding protein n=1 Tax=Marinobacterium rhizophilum TaxID=420402 RepID=UPI0003A1C7A7|nr:helix-hairpin-helix domain-containing protein [Marinobacterium rhizophilum]